MPKKKKKTLNNQVELFKYDYTKTPLQNAKIRLNLEGVKYVVKNEEIAHIVSMDKYQNEISFWANTGTIWFDKKFADSKNIKKSHKEYRGINDYVSLIKAKGKISSIKAYNNWSPPFEEPKKEQLMDVENIPVQYQRHVCLENLIPPKYDYYELRRIQCLLVNETIDSLMFLCDIAEKKKKSTIEIKKLRKELFTQRERVKDWCRRYAKEKK